MIDSESVAGEAHGIIETCGHLLATSTVRITEEQLQKQREIIAAIDRVISMSAYQEAVLESASTVEKFTPKAQGVFFGYDFHLSDAGPRLIEINTNAGGALVNAISLSGTDRQHLELSCIDMFAEEWRLERGSQPLRTIAIVDEQPENQFLWSEFLLFQQLFERYRWRTLICDSSELEFKANQLWYQNQSIDLVYNRLTDFDLDSPRHAALRAAYLANSVVLTPHPHAHALYANKKNLAILTDESRLLAMGVDAETTAILNNGIAQTQCVDAHHADDYWRQRKQLFFKPAKGYGSKAAYRGDKLTRRVFAELLQGDYVAQSLVYPSEWQAMVYDSPVTFKLDLRHYVYRGESQLIVARLYQGQTTNFRTPGGGFARVEVV